MRIISADLFRPRKRLRRTFVHILCAGGGVFRGVKWGALFFAGRSNGLDKMDGVRIIIDRRGRCNRRSTPTSYGLRMDFSRPKKPSPCRVAVSVFEFLNPYRDRMTQDMEREHKKHRVTPFRGLTNRLPYVAASLRAVYTRGARMSIRGEATDLTKWAGCV